MICLYYLLLLYLYPVKRRFPRCVIRQNTIRIIILIYIKDIDPDPIWICEMVDICPINDNAAAKFLSIAVSPKAGPQGTSFNVTASFKVSDTIGTGEIDYAVIPPAEDGFSFGEYVLLFPLSPLYFLF